MDFIKRFSKPVWTCFAGMVLMTLWTGTMTGETIGPVWPDPEPLEDQEIPFSLPYLENAGKDGGGVLAAPAGPLAVGASHDFPFRWGDRDGNGRNTRHDLLYDRCIGVLTHDLRRVVAAVCLDRYNGVLIDSGAPHLDIHVDHLVPRADAVRSGVFDGDLEGWRAFVDDPDNLVITSATTNRSKSDLLAHQWCPASVSIRPWLARRVRMIKDRYDMPVGPAEDAGLQAWTEGVCVRRY